MIKVKANIDDSQISTRKIKSGLIPIIDNRNGVAIRMVARDLLKYGNEFVPYLTGALQRSGIAVENEVVWNTPYAKRWYYTHKTKSHWAEKAIQRYISRMTLTYKRYMATGFNRSGGVE